MIKDIEKQIESSGNNIEKIIKETEEWTDAFLSKIYVLIDGLKYVIDLMFGEFKLF